MDKSYYCHQNHEKTLEALEYSDQQLSASCIQSGETADSYTPDKIKVLFQRKRGSRNMNDCHHYYYLTGLSICNLGISEAKGKRLTAGVDRYKAAEKHWLRGIEDYILEYIPVVRLNE